MASRAWRERCSAGAGAGAPAASRSAKVRPGAHFATACHSVPQRPVRPPQGARKVPVTGALGCAGPPTTAGALDTKRRGRGCSKKSPPANKHVPPRHPRMRGSASRDAASLLLQSAPAPAPRARPQLRYRHGGRCSTAQFACTGPVAAGAAAPLTDGCRWDIGAPAPGRSSDARALPASDIDDVGAGSRGGCQPLRSMYWPSASRIHWWRHRLAASVSGTCATRTHACTRSSQLRLVVGGHTMG